jgi:hypothetical protein
MRAAKNGMRRSARVRGGAPAFLRRARLRVVCLRWHGCGITAHTQQISHIWLAFVIGEALGFLALR